ncbi:Alpha/Beta hydrolase protein [Massariosphaeria phaeospora]|uniref:Alpha/Beta hydrolase protein n=1 Tax=Massariosphaeria phaeospora TaxID=100035 RepID=A0A7C8MGV1_9PLEO|nr:Alpha/Beta hydrolase protein [Massariosphaeria phaeospora]
MPFSKTMWGGALVVLLGVVGAAPVGDVEKRGISAVRYHDLAIMSQYAAAAYCAGNNNSPGTVLTCPQGNCPYVEVADTETLTEFENSLDTDVTGFIALDYTHNIIVLSFRGSVSGDNWAANLNFSTTETTICPTCDAWEGFWESWLEAQSVVLTTIARALEAYPKYKVIATGHSLGGAVASLAAGVLRSQGVPADLYTFGSPKLGNFGLVEYLSSRANGTRTIRVTHKDDIVPQLPPGYWHTGPEYYINADDGVMPSTDEVEVYNQYLSLKGNEGDIFQSDFDAHAWYFGNITGCQSSD